MIETKYETWEELKLTDKFISKLFKNQQAFANAKREDTDKAGQTTILKFLNKLKRRILQVAVGFCNGQRFVSAGQLRRHSFS